MLLLFSLYCHGVDLICNFMQLVKNTYSMGVESQKYIHLLFNGCECKIAWNITKLKDKAREEKILKPNLKKKRRAKLSLSNLPNKGQQRVSNSQPFLSKTNTQPFTQTELGQFVKMVECFYELCGCGFELEFKFDLSFKLIQTHIALASSKKCLDIQATIECRFTLKRDMIIIQSLITTTTVSWKLHHFNNTFLRYKHIK